MALNYLILYKDDVHCPKWKVFDMIGPGVKAEPFYRYVKSINKQAGLMNTDAIDWIKENVET